MKVAMNPGSTSQTSMLFLALRSSGTLIKFAAVEAEALTRERTHLPRGPRIHLLGQSLRLDEDVEVGLLQLLSYHGEDSGRGAELGQVVNDELEEQLEGKHTLSNKV